MAKIENANIPLGRGGALVKNVGVDPGTAVLGKGIVAELGWSELITERGTAVGLVASSVKLGSGADDPAGAPVTGEPGGAPAGAVAGEPAGGAAAGAEDPGAAPTADEAEAETASEAGA